MGRLTTHHSTSADLQTVASSGAPYVVWLEEVGHGVAPGAGAPDPGRWARSGRPTAPGFVVTGEAFRTFLADTGLEPEIRARLDNLVVDDPMALRHASEALQYRLRGAAMPEAVATALGEAYRELARRGLGREPCVVVHSSASAADPVQAAWAARSHGHRTVRGAHELVRTVRDCWASAFEARALFYGGVQRLAETAPLVAAVPLSMHDLEQVSGSGRRELDRAIEDCVW